MAIGMYIRLIKKMLRSFWPKCSRDKDKRFLFAYYGGRLMEIISGFRAIMRFDLCYKRGILGVRCI